MVFILYVIVLVTLFGITNWLERGLKKITNKGKREREREREKKSRCAGNRDLILD